MIRGTRELIRYLDRRTLFTHINTLSDWTIDWTWMRLKRLSTAHNLSLQRRALMLHVAWVLLGVVIQKAVDIWPVRNGCKHEQIYNLYDLCSTINERQILTSFRQSIWISRQMISKEIEIFLNVVSLETSMREGELIFLFVFLWKRNFMERVFYNFQSSVYLKKIIIKNYYHSMITLIYIEWL